MKKTLTIGLSMLILAIACLSCAKDPQTPNTNLEFNGLSVLEEDGYISEVQPVLPDKEYRFGFRMTGNAENQLSRLVVRFNEEVICDTAIGGIEFEYRGVISTRGISGTAEISAVVVYDDYGFSRASIGLIVEEREKQTLPYVQDFSSSFGTYIPVDVRGPQFWRIDGTAVMTNASYYYNRNDDWLVSSPVEITDVTDAKMLMEYRCEGFDNVNKCVTIWALKCNDGDSLALAQWTQLPVTLASVNHDDNYVYYESGFYTESWNVTAEVSLTQFVGSTIYLAVKYDVSDDDLDGETETLWIRNITVKEGTGGGGDVPPDPTPEPPDPTPEPPGEVQSLPYSQSFASDFGTYMTYDVWGSQSWEIEYSTAKICGYENDTYYSNEDWLISAPVDLNGIEEAKMTMAYIGRYFNNISEDVTIWASTDYTWGESPATATWTRINANLTEGTNWMDFLTTEIALTEFVGQTVTLAVKYVSYDGKSLAGTLEIQSITIEEGPATGGDVPLPPEPGGDVQSLPYSQSFASEFGTYMAFDVWGPQAWKIKFSTAQIGGYENGTYYSNEDWLISAPVDLSGVGDAKMTMAYIARYFDNINEDVTIWASTNYNWGDSPATASWTRIYANLTEGTNWNDFLTTEIALTEIVGQTVTLAVKYVSYDGKSLAGTLEIQSITIEEGTATGGDVPTPPTPGGEGSGTAEDPFNVARGIDYQGQDVVAWVQGYIVGVVKSGVTSVSSNDDINWSAPFDYQTNVVIADDPSCQEITECIIVSLPAGTPLRTQVNLLDHPENLGKRLAVLGKLRVYFSQAGLRDSGGTLNDFVLWE